MNLLEDPWIPFRKRSGEIEYLPILAIISPEVVDLALPRADFQGAAYQLLIGLLQTAYAPESVDDWMDAFQSPPNETELASSLEKFQPSFELNEGDGPLFMQDYDNLVRETPIPASSMLIDAPGASTIRNNTDHFVKAGRAETFCLDCSAITLFTMQINAPSGGKGYRTGLRGGGPLTTLVLPTDSSSSLWAKLWLNVLDREELGFSDPEPTDPNLFPWMGPTRASEKGQKTLSTDVHELHTLWAMPRRFRLVVDESNSWCDLCGRETDKCVTSVRVKNYGNNYDGPWQHPLTPYRRDPKQPHEPALSIKGQPSGVGYRHWESLVLEDKNDGSNLPALTVLDYSRKVDECQADGIELSRFARMWAFGYDMDNMKPRGWVGTQLPFLALPSDKQTRLLDWLRSLVGLAKDTCWQLRKSVKDAWFNRPSDIKGDIEYIDNRFWERTESEFYSLLSQLGDQLLTQGVSQMPAGLAARWYRHVRLQALEVFDELALSGPAEAMNMKRVTRARNQFLGWFVKNKTPKNFRKKAGLADTPPPDVEVESAITEQSEGIL